MRVTLICFTVFLFLNTFAQPQDYSTNTITTAVPFLNFCTNARVGGFGEIGTVSSSFYQDAGLYQNPALLANNGRYAGGNMSYAVVAPHLIDELYFFELSGYYSINASNTIAYHTRRFDLGTVSYTDEYGNHTTSGRAIEYFHQLTYSHAFQSGISLGGGMKFIRSNLGTDQIGDTEVKPGNAFAVDVGLNYERGFKLSKVFILNLNVGTSINNFGTKITYVDDDEVEGDFLPTTFRLGVLLNPEIMLPKNFTLSFDFAYQADKLLVPTPPNYKYDDSGKWVIDEGMDPEISPFRALYQSFYDAPGGFEEEIHEIIHKLGSEIRVDYHRKIFLAGRIGKFMEHATRGGRNYLTWGVGAGAYGFTLDYKTIDSINLLVDNNWALTFGFRTTISNPAFRF